MRESERDSPAEEVDGPLIDPRRAGAGFKLDETRGDTAERAVAPLAIEGGGGEGDDVDETRRAAAWVALEEAAVVMMMEMAA